MSINGDLERLIENLPLFFQRQLTEHCNKNQLIEVVLDLGRRPEARFFTGPEYLSQKIISWQDLDYLTKRVSKFSTENRAGIERTLHRVSCIRNRQYLINGLTCRVGRAIFGTISLIRDLLESDHSILILGKPGVGKTTIIREIARVLADEMEERVIIIDTSNEIAGDSDIPHAGIGRARRMQVAKTELQHQIMIEAVENHMPQTIIIDEIGTELEVLAARTIAEKGVKLVGTTHGNCLENLIKNPMLADLIGGIQYVTLSDDEAKRRGTQKSILERKSSPTFEIIIELNEQKFWTIHENVKNSIDLFLRETYYFIQTRTLICSERIKIRCQKSQIFSNSWNSKIVAYSSKSLSLLQCKWTNLNQLKGQQSNKIFLKPINIYAYSLSNNLLKEVISKINYSVNLTGEIKEADVIIGLEKQLKQNFQLQYIAQKQSIPIYTINKVSVFQIAKFIYLIYN